MDEELNNAMARSTYDVLEASSTAMASENARLANELVEREQSNLTDNARENQLTFDLENARATIESFETLGPLITLVSPDVNQELTVGQQVELVIVASDYMDVTSIDFTIGNEPVLWGGPVSEGQLTAVKRLEWIPEAEGVVEIRISAVNANGIQNEITVSLTVLATPTAIEESP